MTPDTKDDRDEVSETQTEATTPRLDNVDEGGEEVAATTSEIEILRGKLRRSIERRVTAQRECGEMSAELRAARYERDMANKRLADHDAGVANLLAQLEIQGAELKARR